MNPGAGDANVVRASRLDTTALSDALDRLGIAGQCLGVKPLDPGFQLAGRAFTGRYGPPPGPRARWETTSTTGAAKTPPSGATS